jgi:hypothetical protein
MSSIEKSISIVCTHECAVWTAMKFIVFSSENKYGEREGKSYLSVQK